MYYAIVYSGDETQEWHGFKTEAELDTYGKTESSYDQETLRDEPEFYQNYDPPIIFAVVADSLDFLDDNRIHAPYAVYVRGEKWVCIREAQP